MLLRAKRGRSHSLIQKKMFNFALGVQKGSWLSRFNKLWGISLLSYIEKGRTNIEARALGSFSTWMSLVLQFVWGFFCLFFVQKQTASCVDGDVKKKNHNLSQSCKSALLLILTIPDRRHERKKKKIQFQLHKRPFCSQSFLFCFNQTKLWTGFYSAAVKSTNPRVSHVKTQMIKMRILLSAGCVYYSSCDNFKPLFFSSQFSHSPWCQEQVLIHPLS